MNKLSNYNNWRFQYKHVNPNISINNIKKIMEQYQSKLIFSKPIPIYDVDLNHIWTNHQHNNLILDHLKHIGLHTN